MHIRFKRFIKKAYIYATTAAAFVITISPAIIRAGGVPQAAVTASPAETQATSTVHLRITAYSSSVDETDSTPFITASGMRVRDGIVATNLLPFGTKVEIPSLFGNKVFTVEDRMAKRLKNVLDIWMPSKTAAIDFGVHYADIVIAATANATTALNKSISEK